MNWGVHGRTEEGLSKVFSASTPGSRYTPSSEQEKFERSVESNLVAVRHFHRQLARYRDYCDRSCRDLELVTVFFQCLTDGEENQLTEIVGIVAL